MKSYSYRYIFLSVISATLLALSYPSANCWFLAWFALVPFFSAVKDKTPAGAGLLGFLTGLVFFYCTIYWLNCISPLATIALVFYLALYFALFAFFARFVFQSGLPIFAKALLLSSEWAALEYVRANLLTGFGWALLGYSQSNFLPAIQIADITGVYGVSFMVVFVNVVIYEYLVGTGSSGDGCRVGTCPVREDEDVREDEEPVPTDTVLRTVLRNRLINFLACVFLITGVFVYGFYKLQTNYGTVSNKTTFFRGNCPDRDRTAVRISLVQGNIPQSLKWDASYADNIINAYFSLTRQAALDKPDLIVWPESSYPADLDSGPGLATGSYLLIGANRFENNLIYNSAFLMDAYGKPLAHYDKLHLVPFGEYMPPVPHFLLKILPEKINMVGDFAAGKDYVVFGFPVRFSVLICFEDIFPGLARRFVKNGATLLVNITNDGWYGISSAPFQHSQASVLRAVENRVPVVRAANTGFSAFISEKGRVLDSLEPFKDSYKTCRMLIDKEPPKTFYNCYGDVFVVFCGLFFIGFISYKLVKSKV
jgi:apolipoprotein N-acyltransferase